MENTETIKQITIYSTTTCSSCKLLMNWLGKKRVSYVKKLVDLDDDALGQFMNVNESAMGVPFAVIEYKSGTTVKISGFNKSKFEEALGL